MTTAPVLAAGETGKRSQIGSFTPIRRSLKSTKRFRKGNQVRSIQRFMDENEILVSLINKDLGGHGENIVVHAGTGLARNEIREKLAVMIAHLMETNFERLCQAMYRLDVPEASFDKAINENPLEEIPYIVADLVIEREMQKVRTRIMYKRGEL